MFAEERQRLIVSQLAEQGRVLARDLAVRFGVSVDSIRRDLGVLEAEGLLRRTHGGAVPVDGTRSGQAADESNMQADVSVPGEAVRRVYSRDPVQVIPSAARSAAPAPASCAREEEYRRLAAVAAGFVERGDRLFLGGHPVHLALAERLAEEAADHPAAATGQPIYEVVTYSLETALRLSAAAGIRVWICGGCPDRRGLVLDAAALEYVRGRRLDLCLWAGEGFSPGYGASMEHPEEAELLRAALAASRTRLAVCDRRCVGHEAFAKVADAQEFDAVLLDGEVPAELHSQLEAAGAQLRTVPGGLSARFR